MSEAPKIDPVKQFIATAKEIISPETSKSEDDPKVPKAILYRDDCHFCQDLKSELAQKGLLDKVKMVNVDSEEGRKMAAESGTKGIPECVVVDEGTKKTRICSLQEYKELMEKGQ
jgi:hypothetical protein